jgi:hypothetical protein
VLPAADIGRKLDLEVPCLGCRCGLRLALFAVDAIHDVIGVDLLVSLGRHELADARGRGLLELSGVAAHRHRLRRTPARPPEQPSEGDVLGASAGVAGVDRPSGRAQPRGLVELAC